MHAENQSIREETSAESMQNKPETKQMPDEPLSWYWNADLKK